MPKIVVFLQFKLKKIEKSLQKYNRLEAELKNATKGATVPRRGGPGPCLSRTGSVERNVEDQLLRRFTKLYRKRKRS